MDLATLDLDPTLTAPEVSNRVYRGFLVYFGETEGADFVREVVEEAGLPLSWFDDPQRWVSIAYSERFTAGVVRRLYGLDTLPPVGHPVWQRWRAAGARAFQRDLVGPIWPMLRALGSPGLLFRNMPGLIARANRVTRVELVRHGPGEVVIRCAPHPDMPPDSPGYCWNRLGHFEAAPQIWGLPPARVEHVHCMHDPAAPADACIYRVRYRDRRVLNLVGLGAILGLGAVAGLGVASLAGVPAAIGALAGGLTAAAGEGWRREQRARRACREGSDDLSSAIGELDARYTQLWDEQQQLRRTLLANRKISGYLAAPLVEEIMRDPETELRLGGERVRAAVLFADIVDFTPRCENSAPEQVVRELNTYFAHVDPIIERHGGVIDKRLGDGVMVVFVDTGDEGRAPLETRAVACALDMLRSLGSCNAALAAFQAPPVQIRVGVSGGEVVRGNVGSPARLEYTVIGDIVNLAARLESQASPGHVLAQRDLVGDAPATAHVVSRRVILVKGKAEPVDVIELAPVAGSPDS